MAAVTVLVSHPFQVITQTEVVDVIHERYIHPFLRCNVNGVAESESRGDLKVVCQIMVMGGGLLQTTLSSRLGWSRGSGQGP